MSKKRKTYTTEFKFSLVIEGLRGEKSIAQLCREYDVTESLYISDATNFWIKRHIYSKTNAAQKKISKPRRSPS